MRRFRPSTAGRSTTTVPGWLRFQADIAGAPHPPAGPDWSVARALAALSAQDAGILRAHARILSHILEPMAALDDPEVRAKLDELAPTLPRYPSTTPTRAQVLAAIHAAGLPVSAWR
jgi:hypothetical protein